MSVFDRFKRKQELADSVQAVEEDEGLPAVNRRSRTGKVGNVVGLTVIVVFVCSMFVGGNSAKETKKAKAVETERVANNMPPLDAATVPRIASPTPAVLPLAFTPVAPPPPIMVVNAPPQNAMGTPANTTPVLDWTDRKRAGTVLINVSSGGGSSSAGPVALAKGTNGNEARSDLALRLEPTVMQGTSAALLPDRNFLITKGTSLGDCVLETAIDSTLPGMTSCLLANDVWSDNSQVRLLERGTQYVGEYQGGIKQGQSRLFLLWTRAKTPHGVIITLNSPGTDPLGRSGVEGWVDNHFVERFGAALMFSLLRDGLAIVAANQQSNGGGTIVYGNTQQASEQAVAKILDSSLNIAPTIRKNQGDVVQIIAARDLDFSSVYGLVVKR